MAKPKCEHEPVFVGTINVRVRGEPEGFVDAWRCTKCGMLFAEERRYPPREDYGIGFSEPQGTLAVVACRDGDDYRWKLVDSAPGGAADCGGCDLTFGEGSAVSSKACRVAAVAVTDAINRNLELTQILG